MTYSIDLITRIIRYKQVTNDTYRRISQLFDISKSIVHKWCTTFHLKKDNNKVSKMDKQHILFIKKSLDHKPFQTQQELLTKLNIKFNSFFTIHTIRSILKIIGYTKKKASRKLHNLNIKEHKKMQKEFKKKIKKINKNKLICIDEIGVTKNSFVNYGYCPSNKRLEYFIHYKELPKKKSIIVAIDSDKVLQHKIIENGNANKIIFIEFMKQLTQTVKDKIFIMDNVKFHKNDIIRKLIEESNNTILFIPPYSPQFNPIEEVFSLFKSYLIKKINPLIGFDKLNHHIIQFFKTATNFLNYYEHAFD